MSNLTQKLGIKDWGAYVENVTRRGSVRLLLEKTMRKYFHSVLAIIALTIIAAKAAEPALDANGNTAKILIPTDAFTIEE
jgi:hypothetical protein